MANELPDLIYEDLLPTRDYLREVALDLSCFQRSFLKKHPRDWHYGLEITVRGLITQECLVGHEPIRVSLDLVRHKLRLGQASWPLREYAAPELYKNLRAWLEHRDTAAKLITPRFEKTARQFNEQQSDTYSKALWWINDVFMSLKPKLIGGVVSPILLYPHHFDVSLVWYPFDDDRQIAIGWSSGDDTIPEPYVYATAYPEPDGFAKLPLPKGAYWHHTGFRGAILTYAHLQASSDPIALFERYAQATVLAVKPLFG